MEAKARLRVGRRVRLGAHQLYLADGVHLAHYAHHEFCEHAVAGIAHGLLPLALLGSVAGAIVDRLPPFFSGPQTALMQERIPPEYLGRVFGLYGSIMAWALPAGLAVSTLLADTVGAPIWFVLAGSSMLVLAVITWLIPSIRHIERVP